MYACPQCSRPNPPLAAFCLFCGTSLWKRCTACSTQLPYTAKFCGVCRTPAPEADPRAPAVGALTLDEFPPNPQCRGRPRELGRTVPLFLEALNGRGRAVIVSGEAGVGKTTVLEQLRAFAEANGFQCRGVRGCASERAASLLPFLRLVKGLVGIADDDPATGSATTQELTRLGLAQSAVDTLREVLTATTGEREVPVEPDARTAALQAAVVQAIAAQARRTPLFIAVDNLHWADEATRRFLSPLIDSIAGSRVFLAVAVRKPRPDIESQHVLALPLKPLDGPVLGQITAGWAGVDRLPRELEDDMDHLFGSPLAAREFLRHLFSNQAIVLEEGRLRVLNRGLVTQRFPSVDPVLALRVQRLSMRQKRVVAALAVLDGHATRDGAAGLAEVGDAIDEELKALTGLQWIRLPREGGVQFAETALLDAVLAQGDRLGVGRMQSRLVEFARLGRPGLGTLPDTVVASAIAALPDAEVSDAAWLEALAGRLAAAAQYGLVVPVRAKLVAALRRRAAVAAADERPLHERRVLAANLALAADYRAVGDDAAAAGAYETCAEYAREYDLPYARIEALKGVAAVHAAAGRLADAETALRAAFDLARERDLKVEIAHTAWRMGRIIEDDERPGTALEWYKAAVEAAPPPEAGVGPRFAVRGRALESLARVTIAARAGGSPGELVREALETAAREGNPFALQAAFERAAQLEIAQRNPGEALKFKENALKVARGAGDFREVARLLYEVGALYLVTKRYDEAAAYLGDAVVLNTQLQRKQGLDAARAALVRIAAAEAGA